MSFTKLLFYPILVLAIIAWFYVLIPFIAPIAYINGYEGLGRIINEAYEYFCHQRVERSVFLFAPSSTFSVYSVGELKEVGYLPERVSGRYENAWPEYFGHDYVGSAEIGYKVPLCIRDLSLYSSLAFILTLLSLVKDKNRRILLSWKYLYPLGIILMLPMILDGVSQTIIENFKISSIPMEYIDNLWKRIVTGCLFGIGVALIVAKLFETNRLTKFEEKGTI